MVEFRQRGDVPPIVDLSRRFAGFAEARVQSLCLSMPVGVVSFDFVA
jgi:hypothetical protein